VLSVPLLFSKKDLLRSKGSAVLENIPLSSGSLGRLPTVTSLKFVLVARPPAQHASHLGSSVPYSARAFEL
jgi:hypothetical protein